MSSLHGSDSRGREGDVVYRILTTVAERERTDPLELPPLAGTVDPDAVERVVAGDGLREVAFTYCGYRVAVDGDGRVSVTDE